MINYRAYELLKEYAQKRYKMSFDELYFIDAVREFYPLEDIMALCEKSGEDAISRFDRFVGDMYYSYLDSPYTSADMYLSPLYADPDGFKDLCIREKSFNSDAWIECITNTNYGSQVKLIEEHYFGYINQRQNYCKPDQYPEISGHSGSWNAADYYKMDNGEIIFLYEDSDGSRVIADETGKILSISCTSITEFLQRQNIHIF